MSVSFFSVSVDCSDAGKLADFWSQALERHRRRGCHAGFRQHRHERRRLGRRPAGLDVPPGPRRQAGQEPRPRRFHHRRAAGRSGASARPRRHPCAGCRRRRVPVGDAYRSRRTTSSTSWPHPSNTRPTPDPLPDPPVDPGTRRALGGDITCRPSPWWPAGARVGYSSITPTRRLPQPGRRTRVPAAPGPRRRGGARSGRASFGIHQLARPSSSMVDGTSTMRTRVASTNTAEARPSPNTLSTRRGRRPRTTRRRRP